MPGFWVPRLIAGLRPVQQGSLDSRRACNSKRAGFPWPWLPVLPELRQIKSPNS